MTKPKWRKFSKEMPERCFIALLNNGDIFSITKGVNWEMPLVAVARLAKKWVYLDEVLAMIEE